jgi:hypothetical protein
MKKLGMLAAVLAIVLTAAGPAYAATGANGAGRAFGQHVSTMAQDVGFSGSMNPGVMHRGFSGWTGM